MKKVLLPISYVLVILATILGTLYFSQNVRQSDSKLEELENLLIEKFVDGVDQKTLEDAAAEAMVDALGDRWSYYISVDDVQAYEENKNNSYVGIGVTIQSHEKGCLIVKVTSGGPADAAGIQAQDIVIAVDGQDVGGMDADQIKALVRGEEGTSVSLTVLRGEEEITVSVKRQTVNTVVATGVMLEDNIGLVTISNFNTNCYKETMAVINDLLDQGATALIFDVRFNGGGYKSEMVKVLDALLPEGPLFNSCYYTGATSTDTSDSNCLDIPMVVLINSESYSAAEFFAAALREYDWAVLVGQQTQGKGHFQETFTLSDGSMVAVSTGRYTTPNGVDLEGVGLTPDYAVEVTNEQWWAIYAGTLDPMEDPQVFKAIEVLKNQ